MWFLVLRMGGYNRRASSPTRADISAGSATLLDEKLVETKIKKKPSKLRATGSKISPTSRISALDSLLPTTLRGGGPQRAIPTEIDSYKRAT